MGNVGELGDLYDLAAMLGMPLNKLTYFVYGLPEHKRYREFDIQKRGGGQRRISAPILPIKRMQRIVADWLTERFQARPHVHSYVKGGDRSIRSNADRHLRQRWLLRVDLEDFFPTIHFGRVRGVLTAPPFSLPPDVAHRYFVWVDTPSGMRSRPPKWK